MQVEKITIVEKSPCFVEPRKFKISAQTDKPLEEIPRILYLALPSSKYSKAYGSLSFLRKGKLVGIFSDGKINLSCFEREDEVKEYLEDLKTLINKAFAYYEKHGPPDPKLIEMREKVSPLEIYNHLPKTNCKECGEQGCFPFAVKLSNGERILQDCPQIQLPKHDGDKKYLEKMLQPIKLES